MDRLVIICVDDETIVLESLRAELREVQDRNYQIELANSGSEALELLEELQGEGYQIPVVISDHIMPGMRGDELLTQVQERSPRTLNILLTGQADVAAIANAINRAGLYRFIAKPWQREDLCLTVSKAVESFLQDRQLAAKTLQLERTVIQLQDKEQQLEEANRTLEQRVQERTQELSQALADLQTAQETMIQSEKMAALGQLIAGIAHEINTPMGVIRAAIGNLTTATERALQDLPLLYQRLSPERLADFHQLLEITQECEPLSSREERQARRALIQTLETQGIPDADTRARQLVTMGLTEITPHTLALLQDPEQERILTVASNLTILRTSSADVRIASEKAAKIVFALKTYAHQDSSGHKTHADLAESIDLVLTLYRNSLKQGVEVLKHYSPELPQILCYPDELNQVWTNLIHNAIHAMEGQGTLEIRLTPQPESIQIEFTDSGRGIPAEVQQRIFEPFFTTKASGEGSGLGLSIVRQIIDKHQGTLDFESYPGRTTFKLTLPMP